MTRAERDAMIIELLKEGLPVREIALRVFLSEARVYQIAKRDAPPAAA